jgi:Ca2+-binding RTX toxin-like protein
MPRPFDAAEYLASYADLQAAYGPEPAAAAWHWQVFGQAEGRACTFDGLCYVVGHADLRAALGADATAGALHFVRFGRLEGRDADAFDAAQYLANYADLRAAFGSDAQAAARHFIVFGAGEGRTDDAPAPRALAFATASAPGELITGTDGADALVGTPGDDTIHGGNAIDRLTGGAGADTFTFGSRWAGTAATAPEMWDGPDTITDFQPGLDKLDFSRLVSAKGYDGAFVGPAPFSTGPFQRDASSYSHIHGDFDSVEVRYRHEGGNTVVELDGPVHIQSAKYNLTPMDGNVDARLTLAGLHTLTAGDVVL